MFSDTIADFFTRIRNGYLAQNETVVMPSSNFKLALAELLRKEGYINQVELKDNPNNSKDLAVTLRYVNGRAAITKVKRVSKAGRRIFRNTDNLPYVLSGIGIAIVSTSQGVMTADQARKAHIGGEVVAEVY